MFTVVLPDIIRRICELSHVWGKKICHSNLSEFFSQTPLYVPIYNQTHSCPLGCSETVRKRFFSSFLQINNITNIGWSQPRKKSWIEYLFSKGFDKSVKFWNNLFDFFPARKTILIDDKSVRDYWHLALTTWERWHASFIISGNFQLQIRSDKFTFWNL
jgi:hypothetical protein